MSIGADAIIRCVIVAPTLKAPQTMRADGLSAKEIGKKLDISSRTVESHKYQIMESLGVQTGAELIRFALRHGIVEP